MLRFLLFRKEIAYACYLIVAEVAHGGRCMDIQLLWSDRSIFHIIGDVCMTLASFWVLHFILHKCRLLIHGLRGLFSRVHLL